VVEGPRTFAASAKEHAVTVLFIHGMGRTPLSGWRLLRRLRRAGLKTATFGYSVIFDNFDAIEARLRTQIALLAATDEYIVIGHSLGGVLLRAALTSLPAGAALPRHVYLLGSPVLASRIATRLKNMGLFRILTGDCGQLLGSVDRMNAIGPPAVPATGIVGTRGISNRFGIFEDEVNDGLVSLSEVCAPWLTSCVQVPVFHTLLPSSPLVADIILQHMAQNAGLSVG
jgi:pimeloyl-ACP methyl ester carboxylesterase